RPVGPILEPVGIAGERPRALDRRHPAHAMLPRPYLLPTDLDGRFVNDSRPRAARAGSRSNASLSRRSESSLTSIGGASKTEAARDVVSSYLRRAARHAC